MISTLALAMAVQTVASAQFAPAQPEPFTVPEFPFASARERLANIRPPAVEEPVPLVPRFTAEQVLLRVASASARAQCIVRYEVGGSGYDPYVVGGQGEQGPVQLHPRGKLVTFYAAGWTNPQDPDQAISFLEAQLLAGQAEAWSPVLLGLC